MYEEFAWKQFLKTGDINTFVEYKKIQNELYEKKGDITNETYQSQGNSDKRNNV